MSDIYSVRLIQELGLTGSTSYVVPDGMVAIARDLDVYEGASLLPDVVYLQGALGQAIWFQVGNVEDGLTYGSWRGRQVFNAGESVTIRAASGTWDVTLSGYLLTAP